MNKNTSLVVAPKIQPPPSKNEICEALFQRAYASHKATCAEAQKQKAALYGSVKDQAIKHVRKSVRQIVPEVSVQYNGTVDVRFTIEKDSPIRAAVEAYRAADKRMPSFDEKAERAKIRLAICGDRVEAMLKDPEVVKNLDAVLLRIQSIPANA